MEHPALYEAKHRRYTITGLLVEQRSTLRDVSLHDTVKIIDCSGGSVAVLGKCKVLLLDSCHGITVEVGGAICGVEVVNCSNVMLDTGASVPIVAIDSSRQVRLQLGGKAEVITANASEVSIRVGACCSLAGRDAAPADSESEPTAASAGPVSSFHTIPTAVELGLTPAGRQCMTFFRPDEAHPPLTVPFERSHLGVPGASSCPA